MSEVINNREFRQKVLKELINELHNGADFDAVKSRFAEIVQDISPTEIAEMEQGLIAEGMPAEEIKRLCDVHVAVFKESLDEIINSEEAPGHPVHTFKKENRAVERFLDEDLLVALEIYKVNSASHALIRIRDGLDHLLQLDKHYSRKENLLFPYLEKYGITAPPAVMWSKDDDIRDKLKQLLLLSREVEAHREKHGQLIEELKALVEMIKDMIYKEENILFPMSLETLTEDEWGSIMEQSDEIGYCLVEPDQGWKPSKISESKKREKDTAYSPGGFLNFETGILTLEEINGIFNSLPIDITFVDKDDTVKYFSQGKDRVFARTKAIIGRKVQHCHPPTSVHIVEEIVEDFKSGKRDHADFWIQMQGMFVYIRYFAVRDKEGRYLGTVEVTQDIKDIKTIEGERRLLEE